jgi:hypothetical protein
MRATDFLTESQHQELGTLTEGPLGRLVGKAVGGVAKGVGAVAGGIAGMGSAFKKGYQSGKAVVSGDDTGTAPAGNQPQAAEKPATPGTPTAGTAADTGKTAATTPTADPNATPKPTATATATNTTTIAQPAADPNATPKPNAVAAPADDTAEPAASTAKETDYAKAMKFVKGLPIAKQKDIIDMLQRDPKVAAAMKAPAATEPAQGQPAAGAEQPAADAAAEKPAGMPAGRFGQEMGRLATPLAGADSETPGAALPQKAAGSRPQGGGRVAGQLSTNSRAVKRREQRAAKKPAGAAQPDLTDPNVPISAAIRQRQAQGLAAGYKNPNTMIKEGFSLFRKQR